MRASKRVLALFMSLAVSLPMFFAMPSYANESADTVEITEEAFKTETQEIQNETETESENEDEEEIIEDEQSGSSKSNGAPMVKSGNVVDFSLLRKTYTKTNDFLLGLNKKVAQYSIASMQALIDSMGDENIAVYLSAEDLSIFDENDEIAANAIADSINSAYSSLEKVSTGVDLSSFLEDSSAINNLDTDAYSDTKSLGSASRIANILVKTTALSYTDPMNSENTSSISSFKGTATQQNIDDATRTILDALYVSIRSYTVTTNSAVTDASFQNGTTSGDESPYTATYGSTIIAYSDNDDTAWYMDFSSDSVSRTRQFQGYGSSFKARIVGNMNIYAEVKETSKPNMIKIFRVYDNIQGTTSVQTMTFTGSTYELPEARVIPYYNFVGYYIDGDESTLFSPGDTVPIAGDTNIVASYEFNGEADCAVHAEALENGVGFNDSVAYNTRIELEGGDNAYAWLEEIETGEYRPFALTSDISFLASESVNLIAVTEAEFNSYSFKLPAINMRKEGTITQSTKVIFNGQIVERNALIREYGVIVGVGKNGYELSDNLLTVENAGNHTDYNIVRAKSTRLVGANQFSISINGLAGKDYIYRGYLIYEKTNGEFVTIYTDVM